MSLSDVICMFSIIKQFVICCSAPPWKTKLRAMLCYPQQSKQYLRLGDAGKSDSMTVKTKLRAHHTKAAGPTNSPHPLLSLLLDLAARLGQAQHECASACLYPPCERALLGKYGPQALADVLGWDLWKLPLKIFLGHIYLRVARTP